MIISWFRDNGLPTSSVDTEHLQTVWTQIRPDKRSKLFDTLLVFLK